MSGSRRTSEARERLLSTAADTIAARGYYAASTSEMLAAAEVPSGVLYHHFGSKEDLAVAALDRVGESVLAEFDAAMAGPGDVLSSTDAVVRGWEQRLLDSDFTVGCPVATTALETAARSAALQAAAARAYGSWVARLESGLREEGHDPARARTVALSVLAAIEGALLLARTLRSVEPMRAARGALPALLGAGNGGPS